MSEIKELKAEFEFLCNEYVNGNRKDDETLERIKGLRDWFKMELHYHDSYLDTVDMMMYAVEG